MKRGRPKKPGGRYKCGKRTIAQRQEDVMATAVEARMRVYGLKPDRPYPIFDEKGQMRSNMTGREIAKSDILGSALGRLEHWGIIKPEQAAAGYDFASTIRDYLATANLQRPSQGKAGFIPSQRSSSDSQGPVRGEMKARGYMEALAEIDRSDPFSAPTSTSVVWDVCINELDRLNTSEIGALRVGLNAVHRILYGRKAA